MDPHIWHKQSLLIDHDHPYSRPSYLEPINFICVEPTFKEEVLSPQNLQWIDVTSDNVEESRKILISSAKTEEDTLSCFCDSSPVETRNAFSVSRNSNLSSSKVRWNTNAGILYRRIEKFLIQADLESSMHKKGSFRQFSIQELSMKRVARYTRKIFTSCNWRIHGCVELHERLLNTLPSNLLRAYLNGFAYLLRQNRVPSLLRRLNNEIISRETMKRFDYSKFLEYASSSPVDGFSPFLSPATPNHSIKDFPGSAYAPITFIPINLAPGPAGNTSTSSYASAVDEPIFICVIGKTNVKGLRVGKMLKQLSLIGRVVIEPAAGASNAQIRRLVRHFLSLSEDTLPIPIYLVGFGNHCDVVLTAAATSPHLLPSSNGGALEETICGRLPSVDAPVPVKPFLAGLIFIAPPTTIYNIEARGTNLDMVARRCSLLLIISSKHLVEAINFREILLNARKRALEGIRYRSCGDKKGPYEFDLRMLVIGGSDHLLRMRPDALRRFATTQGIIDLAINAAIKNLVAVCRTLVNTTISTHESSTVPGLVGGKGCNSLVGASPWFTNTYDATRKKVSNVPAISRKAAILRGGMQSRSYFGNPQVSQSRIMDPSRSFRIHDDPVVTPGGDTNSLLKYSEGQRFQTAGGRSTSQGLPLASSMFVAHSNKRDIRGDLIDSRKPRSVNHIDRNPNTRPR